jgi:hypothetical protein
MTMRFSIEFVQGFVARIVEVAPPAHFQGHGPCRLWTGATHPDGHGKVSVDGVTEYAHRVAFEIANGRKPGPLLRHLCGRASCCADRHLREGTDAENLADQVAHGTYSPPPHPCGEAHPGAALSDDQVEEALRRLEGGETQTAIARSLGVSQPLISQLKRDGGRTCRR